MTNRRNHPYSVPSKATRYDGVVYRSRTEATWAAVLTRSEVRFRYEPLISGLSGYLPDFEVAGRGFIEVKPSRWNGYPTLPRSWHEKAARLHRVTLLPVVIVFGDAVYGMKRDALLYRGGTRPSQLRLRPREVLALLE